jgi:hypothetical protein
LLKSLLSPHQNKGNFPDVLRVVGRFVELNSSTLYARHHPVLKELFRTGCHLVLRRLQAAKAAGIAILLHLLYRDFCQTGQLVVSKSLLTAAYMEVRMSAPLYKQDGLTTMVEVLDSFFRAFLPQNFREQGHLALEDLPGLSLLTFPETHEQAKENMKKMVEKFKDAPYERRSWLALNVALASAQED